MASKVKKDVEIAVQFANGVAGSSGDGLLKQSDENADFQPTLRYGNVSGWLEAGAKSFSSK
jgi:hypothetical protein